MTPVLQLVLPGARPAHRLSSFCLITPRLLVQQVLHFSTASSVEFESEVGAINYTQLKKMLLQLYF